MIEFDETKVLTRIDKRLDKAQFMLDQQVLADSNYYIPMNEKGLRDSGVRGSNLGEIVWDIEYAKKQYYDYPNKSKDVNPNASMKWFEVAKANNLKEWENLVNDKYNE